MLDTLVPILGYYEVKQQWTGDQLRCTAGMGTDIDITNIILILKYAMLQILHGSIPNTSREQKSLFAIPVYFTKHSIIGQRASC